MVPTGLSVGAGLDESRGAARAFAAVVAPETASMAAPIFFWPKVAPTGHKLPYRQRGAGPHGQPPLWRSGSTPSSACPARRGHSSWSTWAT